MKLIGLTLIIIIGICVLVATALSAFFIWIGARFAGVPGATAGKALYAAFLSSVAVWALTGLASAFFGIGSLAGWLLGIMVTLGILKSVYDTGWSTALLVWIFIGVAHVLVGIVMVFFVITGALVLAL